MIMAAAAVRINNSTREEEWAGSFVDVLPRNIYALAVLLIFLRVLQLLTYQQVGLGLGLELRLGLGLGLGLGRG